MRVRVGYWLPVWQENIITIDNKYKIFDTDSYAEQQYIIKQNPELYEDMLIDISGILGQKQLRTNKIADYFIYNKTADHLFYANPDEERKIWDWFVDSEDTYHILAES